MVIKVDSQLTNKAGNLTAAFGADILTTGSTCVPNLLLNYYKKIDLSDSEMMILIHLIRLRAEKKVFPSVEELGKYVNGGADRARQLLESLFKKEILSVISYYNFDDKSTIEGLDFEPLYEKLSELWACDKVREIEAAKNILEKQKLNANILVSEQEEGLNATSDMHNICVAFEREFARPLSPMEVDRIRQWVNKYDIVLVMEALKRAVLMGKNNFRYIDAILLEWSKNNLTTLSEIIKYEEEFQQKRLGYKKEHIYSSVGQGEKAFKNKSGKQEKPASDQKEKYKKIFNALLMS